MQTNLFSSISKLILVNFFALLFMSIFEIYLPSKILSSKLVIWSMYYQVLGVLYAIIVGFILAELLTRFHSILTNISNELNSLEDIRDFLIYIDYNEDVKYNIMSAIQNYLDSVIYREWEVMSHNTVNISSDTSEELFDIMRSIEDIQIYDESDQVALSAVMQKVSDVTTYRTDRLERAKHKLSPVLYSLIVIMSIALVIGFILINIQNLLIHGFIIGAVVTIIYVIHLVINDLNYPFSGLWNINNKSFIEMRDKIKVEYNKSY